MTKHKLSELALIEKGKQIDTKEVTEEGRYRYINGGIKESGYFHSYNTSGENVLISEGGASCGYVNYVNEDFWCGCHCYRLSNAKVLPKYLFYTLKANQDKIMSLRTGAAMPNIKKKTLQDMQLFIDDSKESQQLVVSFLDKVQSELLLKQNELDSLDSLVKSRFIEMFGDPKTNSNNFPAVKPDYICESISAGGDKPKDVSDIQTEEFPYPIFSNGEKDDGLFGWSKDYRIEKPSITVSGRGTIGYASFRKDGKFTPIVRLIVMTPNNRIDPIYLTYFMNMEREQGSGSGVQQLTVPMIKEKDILLPPLDQQKQFSDLVRLIDKSKFVCHSRYFL